MAKDLVATVKLRVSGLGIIFYSPSFAAHIKKGEDYLRRGYYEPDDVERSIVEGKIIGFGTGGGGYYTLRIRSSPPDAAKLDASRYKLRLGINVVDGVVCFRDLYDFLDWDPKCPRGQKVKIANGTYRLTLMTEGWFADHQDIDIHFERWNGMPKLKPNGVPMLNEP